MRKFIIVVTTITFILLFLNQMPDAHRKYNEIINIVNFNN